MTEPERDATGLATAEGADEAPSAPAAVFDITVYLRRWRWPLGFGVVALLLVIRNFSGLATSPPGLYIDESSIGYNAWAVAHHGVDEHGVGYPLFFEAFGEFKNPVYIYLLAPLTRLFALTPAVERLPAAILGMVTCLAIAGTAWRLSRSRPITIVALIMAAFTPWLTQESRVGFEVIAMVAVIAVALFCLSGASPGRPGHYVLVGFFFGLAIFAYSTARFEVAPLILILAVCYGVHRLDHGDWWIAIIPVAIAYAIFFQWSGQHPGALTARFDIISIDADHPTVGVLVQRFADNYVQHLGFPFLLTHGDSNLRHNTGFGGMLQVTSLPLIALGAVACVRRWREPFPVFVLAGAFLGPIPSALTTDGIPHALRSVDMLPFIAVIAIYGLIWLGELVTPRVLRGALLGVGVLMVLEGGAYTWDLFHAYPARSAGWFDTGVESAISNAYSQLGPTGHMAVSDTFEQPYIQVLFALTPDPPTSPSTGGMVDPGISSAPALQALRVSIVNGRVDQANLTTGDIAVLSPTDPAPAHSVVMATEYAAPSGSDPPTPTVDVYRITAP